MTLSDDQLTRIRPRPGDIIIWVGSVECIDLILSVSKDIRRGDPDPREDPEQWWAVTVMRMRTVNCVWRPGQLSVSSDAYAVDTIQLLRSNRRAERRRFSFGDYQRERDYDYQRSQYIPWDEENEEDTP